MMMCSVFSPSFSFLLQVPSLVMQEVCQIYIKVRMKNGILKTISRIKKIMMFFLQIEHFYLNLEQTNYCFPTDWPHGQHSTKHYKTNLTMMFCGEGGGWGGVSFNVNKL